MAATAQASKPGAPAAKTLTPSQSATRRYRLLAGRHADASGVYDAADPAKNVVESTVDLVDRFGASKFAAMSGNEPSLVPVSTDDGLEDLMIDKLIGMAREEGIDLGGATEKPQVIAILRAAFRAN